jgi:hypothetical protein
MKKIALATVLTIASLAATAADFVAYDVDHVKDTTTKAISTAEYIRAGKEVAGVQLGLQGRTGIYHNNAGTFSSLETTVGKNIGAFTPYVGYGYDNGVSGKPASKFDYGLVGANYGTKAGPGFALVGVKTRVNWNDANPKQSVAWATYSIPVTKGVSVNLNASKSYQTITENAYGLGVGFSF